MRPVEITPVTRSRDKKAFIELPKRLYSRDPHWIAPLDLEQRERLFGNNPFFDHAECHAWLALRDGKPVGRITAQVDQLVDQDKQGKTGYFGMLEAENDDEIFAVLLSTAEAWLKAQGIEKVQGPFNLSINEETGLLIEGFDTPPMVMMGHALPYTANALESLGYSKAKDLYAYTITTDKRLPEVADKLVARFADKFTIRKLDKKHTEAEFETLRDIFNDAWSENWGFVPFTEAEFREMAKMLSYLIADDYVQIAEVNGEPAAFIVVLPDINEAARDLNGRLLPFGWAKLLWRLKIRQPHSARIPLMGVRKKFHKTRMGPALAFSVIDAVCDPIISRGVKRVEMGWILEDNSSMRNIIETVGGVAYKTYRVFEKNL